MLNRLPRLVLLLLCIIFLNVVIAREKGGYSHLTKAESLLDSAQYEQAISEFQAYINSSDKLTAEDKDTVAYCYNQIALCYYQLDKYDLAIGSCQAALDIQLELGDKESIASTLNDMGMNYKMRGNYDKAIECFEQTISIDEELGNEDDISITLNNIGMIYRAWGKYDKAIEYLERSLRLKHKMNDQPGVSVSLNNIGLVYTEWQKFDQAILSFRQSLIIEDSLNNEAYIALRLNNLGRVYFYMKQFDTALVYFNKALLKHQENNDKDQIALTLNNIGKVFYTQLKYNDAANCYSQALNIYNELGRDEEKATVLANLSQISHTMGNDAEALQLLDSSNAIAERIDLKSQLQTNFKLYSTIYSDKGEYERSLEYYKKYTELKDSVYKIEILSKLSEFQIKYETEKKEIEIELLKKNEVIQALALKKQTIQRNSMLALSVLFLLLAALIFYGFQTKKRDNRIIVGERERSDRLLLNILPSGIAQDLKEKGKTEPKVFENVTACFIDIVNFTEKTSLIDPVILIGELNDIFTAFDNIIEKYSCERIKTIGDCYLAISGLPVPDPQHAKQIVRSCLEMIGFMIQRNSESGFKWEIRVGINSGEVIAGVVGVKKYIYDVFGDTINTASRMESNSEPMKINISEATYHLIKDEFETEYRGELEVRGKGKLKMYFVKY